MLFDAGFDVMQQKPVLSLLVVKKADESLISRAAKMADNSVSAKKEWDL
jgi:hypothetical protein